MENISAIYRNIVKLAESKNIKILQIESECNLGNGTIGGWKNGRPRVDLIKRVADYFSVTVDELLKDE